MCITGWLPVRWVSVVCHPSALPDVASDPLPSAPSYLWDEFLLSVVVILQLSQMLPQFPFPLLPVTCEMSFCCLSSFSSPRCCLRSPSFCSQLPVRWVSVVCHPSALPDVVSVPLPSAPSYLWDEFLLSVILQLSQMLPQIPFLLLPVTCEMSFCCLSSFSSPRCCLRSPSLCSQLPVRWVSVVCHPSALPDVVSVPLPSAPSYLWDEFLLPVVVILQLSQMLPQFPFPLLPVTCEMSFCCLSSFSSPRCCLSSPSLCSQLPVRWVSAVCRCHPSALPDVASVPLPSAPSYLWDEFLLSVVVVLQLSQMLPQFPFPLLPVTCEMSFCCLSLSSFSSPRCCLRSPSLCSQLPVRWVSVVCHPSALPDVASVPLPSAPSYLWDEFLLSVVVILQLSQMLSQFPFPLLPVTCEMSFCCLSSFSSPRCCLSSPSLCSQLPVRWVSVVCHPSALPDVASDPLPSAPSYLWDEFLLSVVVILQLSQMLPQFPFLLLPVTCEMSFCCLSSFSSPRCCLSSPSFCSQLPVRWVSVVCRPSALPDVASVPLPSAPSYLWDEFLLSVVVILQLSQMLPQFPFLLLPVTCEMSFCCLSSFSSPRCCLSSPSLCSQLPVRWVSVVCRCHPSALPDVASVPLPSAPSYLWDEFLLSVVVILQLSQMLPQFPFLLLPVTCEMSFCRCRPSALPDVASVPLPSAPSYLSDEFLLSVVVLLQLSQMLPQFPFPLLPVTCEMSFCCLSLSSFSSPRCCLSSPSLCSQLPVRWVSVVCHPSALPDVASVPLPSAPSYLWDEFLSLSSFSSPRCCLRSPSLCSQLPVRWVSAVCRCHPSALPDVASVPLPSAPSYLWDEFLLSVVVILQLSQMLPQFPFPLLPVTCEMSFCCLSLSSFSSPRCCLSSPSLCSQLPVRWVSVVCRCHPSALPDVVSVPLPSAPSYLWDEFLLSVVVILQLSQMLPQFPFPLLPVTCEMSFCCLSLSSFSSPRCCLSSPSLCSQLPVRWVSAVCRCHPSALPDVASVPLPSAPSYLWDEFLLSVVVVLQLSQMLPQIPFPLLPVTCEMSFCCLSSFSSPRCCLRSPSLCSQLPVRWVSAVCRCHPSALPDVASDPLPSAPSYLWDEFLLSVILQLSQMLSQFPFPLLPVTCEMSFCCLSSFSSPRCCLSSPSLCSQLPVRWVSVVCRCHPSALPDVASDPLPSAPSYLWDEFLLSVVVILQLSQMLSQFPFPLLPVTCEMSFCCLSLSSFSSPRCCLSSPSLCSQLPVRWVSVVCHPSALPDVASDPLPSAPSYLWDEFLLSVILQLSQMLPQIPFPLLPVTCEMSFCCLSSFSSPRCCLRSPSLCSQLPVRWVSVVCHPSALPDVVSVPLPSAPSYLWDESLLSVILQLSQMLPQFPFPLLPVTCEMSFCCLSLSSFSSPRCCLSSPSLCSQLPVRWVSAVCRCHPSALPDVVSVPLPSAPSYLWDEFLLSVVVILQLSQMLPQFPFPLLPVTCEMSLCCLSLSSFSSPRCCLRSPSLCSQLPVRWVSVVCRCHPSALPDVASDPLPSAPSYLWDEFLLSVVVILQLSQMLSQIPFPLLPVTCEMSFCCLSLSSFSSPRCCLSSPSLCSQLPVRWVSVACRCHPSALPDVVSVPLPSAPSYLWDEFLLSVVVILQLSQMLPQIPFPLLPVTCEMSFCCLSLSSFSSPRCCLSSPSLCSQLPVRWVSVVCRPSALPDVVSDPLPSAPSYLWDEFLLPVVVILQLSQMLSQFPFPLLPVTCEMSFCCLSLSSFSSPRCCLSSPSLCSQLPVRWVSVVCRCHPSALPDVASDPLPSAPSYLWDEFLLSVVVILQLSQMLSQFPFPLLPVTCEMSFCCLSLSSFSSPRCCLRSPSLCSQLPVRWVSVACRCHPSALPDVASVPLPSAPSYLWDEFLLSVILQLSQMLPQFPFPLLPVTCEMSFCCLSLSSFSSPRCCLSSPSLCSQLPVRWVSAVCRCHPSALPDVVSVPLPSAPSYLWDEFLLSVVVILQLSQMLSQFPFPLLPVTCEMSFCCLSSFSSPRCCLSSPSLCSQLPVRWVSAVCRCHPSALPDVVSVPLPSAPSYLWDEFLLSVVVILQLSQMLPQIPFPLLPVTCEMSLCCLSSFSSPRCCLRSPSLCSQLPVRWVSVVCRCHPSALPDVVSVPLPSAPSYLWDEFLLSVILQLSQMLSQFPFPLLPVTCEMSFCCLSLSSFSSPRCCLRSPSLCSQLPVRWVSVVCRCHPSALPDVASVPLPSAPSYLWDEFLLSVVVILQLSQMLSQFPFPLLPVTCEMSFCCLSLSSFSSPRCCLSSPSLCSQLPVRWVSVVCRCHPSALPDVVSVPLPSAPSYLWDEFLLSVVVILQLSQMLPQFPFPLLPVTCQMSFCCLSLSSFSSPRCCLRSPSLCSQLPVRWVSVACRCHPSALPDVASVPLPSAPSYLWDEFLLSVILQLSQMLPQFPFPLLPVTCEMSFCCLSSFSSPRCCLSSPSLCSQLPVRWVSVVCRCHPSALPDVASDPLPSAPSYLWDEFLLSVILQLSQMLPQFPFPLLPVTCEMSFCCLSLSSFSSPRCCLRSPSLCSQLPVRWVSVVCHPSALPDVASVPLPSAPSYLWDEFLLSVVLQLSQMLPQIPFPLLPVTCEMSFCCLSLSSFSSPRCCLSSPTLCSQLPVRWVSVVCCLSSFSSPRCCLSSPSLCSQLPVRWVSVVCRCHPSALPDVASDPLPSAPSYLWDEFLLSVILQLSQMLPQFPFPLLPVTCEMSFCCLSSFSSPRCCLSSPSLCSQLPVRWVSVVCHPSALPDVASVPLPSAPSYLWDEFLLSVILQLSQMLPQFPFPLLPVTCEMSFCCLSSFSSPRCCLSSPSLCSQLPVRWVSVVCRCRPSALPDVASDPLPSAPSYLWDEFLLSVILQLSQMLSQIPFPLLPVTCEMSFCCLSLSSFSSPRCCLRSPSLCSQLPVRWVSVVCHPSALPDVVSVPLPSAPSYLWDESLLSVVLQLSQMLPQIPFPLLPVTCEMSFCCLSLSSFSSPRCCLRSPSLCSQLPVRWVSVVCHPSALPDVVSVPLPSAPSYLWDEFLLSVILQLSQMLSQFPFPLLPVTCEMSFCCLSLSSFSSPRCCLSSPSLCSQLPVRWVSVVCRCRPSALPDVASDPLPSAPSYLWDEFLLSVILQLSQMLSQIPFPLLPVTCEMSFCCLSLSSFSSPRCCLRSPSLCSQLPVRWVSVVCHPSALPDVVSVPLPSAPSYLWDEFLLSVVVVLQLSQMLPQIPFPLLPVTCEMSFCCLSSFSSPRCCLSSPSLCSQLPVRWVSVVCHPSALPDVASDPLPSAPSYLWDEFLLSVVVILQLSQMLSQFPFPLLPVTCEMSFCCLSLSSFSSPRCCLSSPSLCSQLPVRWVSAVCRCHPSALPDVASVPLPFAPSYLWDEFLLSVVLQLSQMLSQFPFPLLPVTCEMSFCCLSLSSFSSPRCCLSSPPLCSQLPVRWVSVVCHPSALPDVVSVPLPSAPSYLWDEFLLPVVVILQLSQMLPQFPFPLLPVTCEMSFCCLSLSSFSSPRCRLSSPSLCSQLPVRWVSVVCRCRPSALPDVVSVPLPSAPSYLWDEFLLPVVVILQLSQMLPQFPSPLLPVTCEMSFCCLSSFSSPRCCLSSPSLCSQLPVRWVSVVCRCHPSALPDVVSVPLPSAPSYLWDEFLLSVVVILQLSQMLPQFPSPLLPVTCEMSFCCLSSFSSPRCCLSSPSLCSQLPVRWVSVACRCHPSALPDVASVPLPSAPSYLWDEFLLSVVVVLQLSQMSPQFPFPLLPVTCEMSFCCLSLSSFSSPRCCLRSPSLCSQLPVRWVSVVCHPSALPDVVSVPLPSAPSYLWDEFLLSVILQLSQMLSQFPFPLLPVTCEMSFCCLSLSSFSSPRCCLSSPSLCSQLPVRWVSVVCHPSALPDVVSVPLPSAPSYLWDEFLLSVVVILQLSQMLPQIPFPLLPVTCEMSFCCLSSFSSPRCCLSSPSLCSQLPVRWVSVVCHPSALPDVVSVPLPSAPSYLWDEFLLSVILQLSQMLPQFPFPLLPVTCEMSFCCLSSFSSPRCRLSSPSLCSQLPVRWVSVVCRCRPSALPDVASDPLPSAPSYLWDEFLLSVVVILQLSQMLPQIPFPLLPVTCEMSFCCLSLSSFSSPRCCLRSPSLCSQLPVRWVSVVCHPSALPDVASVPLPSAPSYLWDEFLLSVILQLSQMSPQFPFPLLPVTCEMSFCCLSLSSFSSPRCCLRSPSLCSQLPVRWVSAVCRCHPSALPDVASDPLPSAPSYLWDEFLLSVVVILQLSQMLPQFPFPLLPVTCEMSFCCLSLSSFSSPRCCLRSPSLCSQLPVRWVSVVCRCRPSALPDVASDPLPSAPSSSSPSAAHSPAVCGKHAQLYHPKLIN